MAKLFFFVFTGLRFKNLWESNKSYIEALGRWETN